MLNDIARCQGAIVSAATETESFPQPITDKHPQCKTCARHNDTMDGVNYFWMASPLGMLADPDTLCPARIST